MSENESKNDSTSNFDEQINNSTRNDEDKNSAIKNSETMKEGIKIFFQNRYFISLILIILNFPNNTTKFKNLISNYRL